MKSRIVVLVFLATLTAGCKTWRPVGPITPELTTRTSSDQLRVRLDDSESLVLRDWVVTEDSVRGRATGMGFTNTPRSVPIDEIWFVEERRLSVGRTIGLAALSWGVVSTIWAVVAYSNCNSGWFC